MEESEAEARWYRRICCVVDFGMSSRDVNLFRDGDVETWWTSSSDSRTSLHPRIRTRIRVRDLFLLLWNSKRQHHNFPWNSNK